MSQSLSPGTSSSEEWRSHLYLQAPLRNSFSGDFRLLTIQSRKYASIAPSFNATTTVPDDDSLHGILKLANLKRPPAFYVISHACNPHGDAKSILINGAPVPVSNDLLLALQHVQRQDEPVTVWIDALCINAADVSEKSAQMSQLSAILEASERTIVWLGPAADGSDGAMEALSRIFDESQQQTIHRRTESWGNKLIGGWKASLSSSSQPQSPTSPKEDLGDLLPRLKPSFTSLLERPYWSRAWSLQELAHSAKCDIFCGKQQMDASRFFKAATSLDMLTNKSTISKWLESGEAKMSPGAQNSLEHMEPANFSRSSAVQLLTKRSEYRRAMGRSKRPLLTVLQRHLVLPIDSDHEFRKGEAEDPCDAIRSLMGLATDLQELGLAMDYERDYTGLCHDISAALLKQSAHPLQLCNNQSEALDLPSWAIHWTKAKCSPLQLTLTQCPFSACGPADHRFYRANINPLGQLVLRGVIVDTVKSVSDLTLREKGHPDQQRVYLSKIKTLWGESLTMETTPYKSEQTMEALARIPVADIQIQPGPPLYAKRAGEDIVVQYQRALEDLSENGSGDADEAARETTTAHSGVTVSQGPNEYLTAIDGMVGWMPFITGTGYVGLASSKLNPEDIIAIPYGSSVPFALRRKDGETHQLLGQVYLHGVMDGEFMKVHRKETSLQLV